MFAVAFQLYDHLTLGVFRRIGTVIVHDTRSAVRVAGIISSHRHQIEVDGLAGVILKTAAYRAGAA
ncbi:MAG: hypothetical protein ACLUDF_01350 [Butyricicoccus sp.]